VSGYLCWCCPFWGLLPRTSKHRIRIQKINILRYVVYFKFKIDFRALTGDTAAPVVNGRGQFDSWMKPANHRTHKLSSQGAGELGSWGADSTTSLSQCRNPQGWHWFAGGGKGRGRRSPGSANYDPVRSRIGTEQPARLNCFCVIAFSKWILVPLPPITV